MNDVSLPAKTALEETEKELFRRSPLSLLDSGYLKIKTKDARLIPLRLNAVQKQILASINVQRKEGQPVRVAVLKFRQGGVSTALEGITF